MTKYNIGDILRFNSQAFSEIHEYGMIMEIVSNVYNIRFLDTSQEHQYYIDYVDASKHISLAA